jgi:hypothetical protein
MREDILADFALARRQPASLLEGIAGDWGINERLIAKALMELGICIGSCADGGGFPNRCKEFPSEVGLTSHDLRRKNSHDTHVFSVMVHQKRATQISRTVPSC